MTTQTEAERLAKALEGDHPAVPGARTKNEAAAELRRLQAEIERLNKALAEQPRAGGTLAQPSQPLTDEQLEKMWRDGPYDHGTLYDFKLAARATEAAHGINAKGGAE